MQQLIKDKPSIFEGEGYKVLFDILKKLPRSTAVSEVYYEFGLRSKGASKINNRVIRAYIRSLFR